MKSNDRDLRFEIVEKKTETDDRNDGGIRMICRERMLTTNLQNAFLRHDDYDDGGVLLSSST